MNRSERHDLGSLASLPVVEAAEFREWRPRDHAVGKSRDSVPTDSLNDAEKRFLKAVVEHPGQPSGMYTKFIRMGPAQGAKARRRLVELGLIREHAVNTAARGRPSIIVEPLAGAREALTAKERV